VKTPATIAVLLAAALTLTACGSSGGDAEVQPTGEAQSSVPTTAATEADATTDDGDTKPRMVALNQDITRADGYSFTLRASLSYGHGTEDVAPAPPGQTTAVLPGIDLTPVIINTTPGRILTVQALSARLALVYPADSVLCADGFAIKFDNGTCGVTAGMFDFGDSGRSVTVAPDDELSASATRFFDTVAGLGATTIRVSGIPESDHFETYATALDDAIGMVAITNDDTLGFDLPVLCTVPSASGGSDAIIAQSESQPVCS